MQVNVLYVHSEGKTRILSTASICAYNQLIAQANSA